MLYGQTGFKNNVINYVTIILACPILQFSIMVVIAIRGALAGTCTRQNQLVTENSIPDVMMHITVTTSSTQTPCIENWCKPWTTLYDHPVAEYNTSTLSRRKIIIASYKNVNNILHDISQTLRTILVSIDHI